MHRLPVLWFVDGVVAVDAGLLLDNLRLGAGAGHGAAEEDVDEEHDPEQDPKGDAEVGQPVGVGRSWWRGCKVYSTVVKFLVLKKQFRKKETNKIWGFFLLLWSQKKIIEFLSFSINN